MIKSNMKDIKLFEDFRNNNADGSLITSDDIRNCIKAGGVLYATIIKDFADNDPEEPLTPVSIDEDGLVTVQYDNKQYEVSLKNIESIEY
jgi:hypothetical protein